MAPSSTLTFAGLLLLLLLLPPPTTTTSLTDTDALTIFRLAADAHGNLAANWSTPDDACSARWIGTRCSPAGRVTSLSLPSLDLRGPLDPLAALRHLRRLDLRSNRLNGTLLLLLPSLPNVRFLDLSGNNLVGEIPGSGDELRNLTRLRILRINDNLLSGPLPDLSLSLPKLSEFNASNNRLTGRVPDGVLAKFGPLSFTGNAGLCGPCSATTATATAPPVSLPSSARSQSAKVPSNPSSISGGEGLKRGAIVAIAVGNAVLLVVILSLSLAYCCRWFWGTAEDSKVGGDGDGDAFTFADVEGRVTKNKKSDGSDDSCTDASPSSPASKMVFLEGRWKRFGLEELLRSSAEMVGKGSLGTVYRAVLEDGSMVAVKRLRDANPCSRKEFHRYMELIGRLRHHPNLVPLRAYYFANQEKLLIYDFLPNGTLHSILHGNRGSGRIPLDWTTRIDLVIGAARGLARIHDEYSSSRIPHGNVKTSNVLLDKRGIARVADFGLALLLSPAQAVTRLAGYMAPEQSDAGGQRLSQEADVYGFGILILEVLTGKSPAEVAAVGLPEWVRSVVKAEWTAEVFDAELMRYKNTEEEMVALLHVGLACVAREPVRRPKMSEVVRMVEDIRAEGSPPDEGDGDDTAASLSPSIATTTEDGRLSYVTDC